MIVSDGVYYDYWDNRETGGGYGVSSVMIGGSPIDVNEMYSVATIDFVAGGGGGYYQFLNGILLFILFVTKISTIIPHI